MHVGFAGVELLWGCRFQLSLEIAAVRMSFGENKMICGVLFM